MTDVLGPLNDSSITSRDSHTAADIGCDPIVLLTKDGFEKEFRRTYRELYPNEMLFYASMQFYYEKYLHSGMQFAEVNPDSTKRIIRKQWLFKENTNEDYNNPPEFNYEYSSFQFKDIPQLTTHKIIDIVYVSPKVPTGYGRFHPETFETHVGKCICGLRNNGLLPGNFSRHYWQSGTLYDMVVEFSTPKSDNPFAVVEPGAFTSDGDLFQIVGAPPTLDRPVLLVSGLCEEGVMLGEAMNYYSGKGQGLFAKANPKVPLFVFTGKIMKDMGLSYILDVFEVH